MKYSLNLAALFVASASAHSWLHCTDYDNSKILDWMKGNATENPQFPVDPIMFQIGEFCKGWPRAKANPGDWIAESSNYIWDIQAKVAAGDNNACHPSQRESNYMDNAPMAKAKAGGKLKLMFGGNGHTRGSSVEGQGKPGAVVVYWTGKPDSQIKDVGDMKKENELHRQGFADESFSYPEDPNIWKPEQGLMDKGNWQTFTIPEGTAPGKYSFVWVWRYNEKPQWSTCFDVQVQ